MIMSVSLPQRSVHFALISGTSAFHFLITYFIRNVSTNQSAVPPFRLSCFRSMQIRRFSHFMLASCVDHKLFCSSTPKESSTNQLKYPSMPPLIHLHPPETKHVVWLSASYRSSPFAVRPLPAPGSSLSRCHLRLLHHHA